MASKRRMPRALSLPRPFSVNPRSKSSGSPLRADPCLMMPSDLGWLPGVRGARPSGLLGERGENPPSASARHAKCTHARHMPLPPGSPGGSLRLRMDRYISGPGDNNSFPTQKSTKLWSEIAVYPQVDMKVCGSCGTRDPDDPYPREVTADHMVNTMNFRVYELGSMNFRVLAHSPRQPPGEQLNVYLSLTSALYYKLYIHINIYNYNINNIYIIINININN